MNDKPNSLRLGLRMNIADPKIAADTSPLLATRQGNIAIATLNRPAARNALSEEMLVSLTALLAELAADKSVGGAGHRRAGACVLRRP